MTAFSLPAAGDGAVEHRRSATYLKGSQGHGRNQLESSLSQATDRPARSLTGRDGHPSSWQRISAASDPTPPAPAAGPVPLQGQIAHP